MLAHDDILEFEYNGFVVRRPRNNWAVEDTDYIIPYYAIKNISNFDDYYLEVELKSQLSPKYSFNKVLYKIDGEKKFKVKFSSNYDKQFFIYNIKKYIEDEKLDIVFK